MLCDVQAVDFSRIAELVEQLILILLQKSADHGSPAQALEPAEDDVNHQGLARELLSSGRTYEEVENKGMLKIKTEQEDDLRIK